MPRRNNVLWSYTLAMLVATILLSVTLGYFLTRNLTEYELRSHVQTFPEILRLAFEEDAETEAWFVAAQATPPPPHLLDHLNQLWHLGHIYRIKVWSPDTRVLWSDDAAIVGTQLPNQEVLEALADGEPVFEIGEVDKAENASEKGRGLTLQIYTPVVQKGRAVGVVELYEDNAELWAQIADNTAFVWVVTLTFGLVLYGVLFVVFFRAWSRQRRTNHELDQTQDVTVFALAYQAELRDHETGEHLERTARYVERLANALRLPRAQVRDLVKAAPLHDIGKVGIPDSILMKPGKLTDDERKTMQTHCELGDHVLAAAESRLPFRSFLTTARELNMTHHERWDGTGYPKGLAGEAIPLAGRIMAVADVYDALRSERPYKPAWSHAQAAAELRRVAGSHLDPRLVEVFLNSVGDLADHGDGG